MKEIMNDEFYVTMEMDENEIITVKELYEWAVKNEAENFKLTGDLWVNRWIILKKGNYVSSETDENFIVTD